jgi:predicted ester cyclase
MDLSESVLVRWLDAGDRGDVEAFDALLHADAVVHAIAAMPDMRHEVQEVVAEGTTEMARVVVSGTLHRDFAGVRARARSFRMDQAVICHLRDGRIDEAWEIADVGSLVEQVT